MEIVRFIRPSQAVEVPLHPDNPYFTAQRQECAAAIRSLMGLRGEAMNVDAATLESLTPNTLSDGDTAAPRGPVKLRSNDPVFEVNVDPSFVTVEDGFVAPAETIVMPLHATTVLFCGEHNRSDSWYCAGLLTCEDERLLAGDSERPHFIWMFDLRK